MGWEKETRCSTTEQSFVVIEEPTADGEAADAAEDGAEDAPSGAAVDTAAAIAELQYSKRS